MCTPDTRPRHALGQVDFAGGEFVAARTARLASGERDPGDDYGWWCLDAERLLAYNETLDAPLRSTPAPDRAWRHPPDGTGDRPAPLDPSVGGAG